MRHRGIAAIVIAFVAATTTASGQAANQLTAAERSAGWRLLFDGKTLTGWRGLGYDSVPTAHWRVTDGTIQKIASGSVPKMPDGQPANGGDLMTVDTFRDFELAFEWKVSTAANSGVKYNVSEEFSLKNASNHAALGFEYQVLDDSLSDDNKQANHLAGALYDMIPPNNRKHLAQVGEWNSSRIIFRGNHGEHWLNGQKVVEFDMDTPQFAAQLAKSKYHSIAGFADRKTGHIILQDHGDETFYRDIKIREAQAMTDDNSDTSNVDRRDFIKSASATGLGVMMAGALPSTLRGAGASANDKIVIAVMGLNGRGQVHAQNFSRLKNTEVAYLCDVDSTVLGKAMADASKGEGRVPKGIDDFRRALDDKSVDAVSIATPDHWHTPMAILAMKAGKHVYVEKPCGHNAHEGEMLVAAQKKYGRVVQMGTQQRSSDRTIEALAMIKDGAIGKPYLARAWYANTRVGIGHGKTATVPQNLNYELWQGPAPRTPYLDNTIHYNWHWFTRWGTGEICNNGTHEIDIARLALGVDYPTRVLSNGGRYHFQDDWQFPDTQEVTFEFGPAKTIVWQGQSCNGLSLFDRGRGTAILGTNGSIVLDRSGYLQYDVKQKLVKQNIEPKGSGNGLELTGDDAATSVHMQNFADAIRSGGTLRAPISDSAKTVLLCHLGNIAQATGRALHTDPTNGHIVGDADANKHWGREYAPGWAPTV